MEAFKNRLKRQRNDFTLNLYQWDDGNLMEEVILILLNIMSNASMGRFQLELNWNYHLLVIVVPLNNYVLPVSLSSLSRQERTQILNGTKGKKAIPI